MKQSAKNGRLNCRTKFYSSNLKVALWATAQFVSHHCQLMLRNLLCFDVAKKLFARAATMQITYDRLKSGYNKHAHSVGALYQKRMKKPT